MATKKDWEKVQRYFKPVGGFDKWGNPDELNPAHLHRLFDFRSYIGVPIYVTRGVQTEGHTEGSYHYTGDATDQVIPAYRGNCIDLIMDAERFGFRGIGYYPHWGFNGKIVGGLHLDSRPLKRDKDGTINYREARWMGILKDEKQVYIALNYDNIKKYGRY